MTPYGRPFPNEHRGQRLGEFSQLSCDEIIELEHFLKPGTAAYDDFLAQTSGTVAEKILRRMLESDTLGLPFSKDIFTLLTDDLREYGVELTAEQVEKLVSLAQDCHNHEHLWCVKGWSPHELYSAAPPAEKFTVTIGPNLRKAFETGEIDREEYIRALNSLGATVIE